MPRLVTCAALAFVFIFLIVSPAPALGIESSLKIVNAYSAGDKIAFLLLNETSNGFYGVVYDGRSFEAEKLPFGREYIVRHWNGKYWLLQKGNTVTVKLYLYRHGKFELVHTFRGGSACTDNDLDIAWNGREYYITFLGAGPNDDLAHGECSYEFRDYLLKDGTVLLLNVTGLERWVPQLNAWLVVADSWIYLVDENGNVLTKRKISETGWYSTEIAVDGNRTFLVVSADGGWVRMFTIENSSLVLTYNRRLENRTPENAGIYLPDFWIGSPILFRESQNGSTVAVWVFNGTDFAKIRTFEDENDYTELHALVTSNKGYILSTTPIFGNSEGASLRLELFELRNLSLVPVNSLNVNDSVVGIAYVRYYGSFGADWPWRTLSGLKVEPRFPLVVSGGSSVLFFNLTHVFNLTSGEGVELPGSLKGSEYGVVFCCGEWLVFGDDSVYAFKNGEFENLTIKMLSSLYKKPRSGIPLGAVIKSGLAAIAALVAVAILRRRNDGKR